MGLHYNFGSSLTSFITIADAGTKHACLHLAELPGQFRSCLTSFVGIAEADATYLCQNLPETDSAGFLFI